MSTQIQIRRDSTANWESVNPVLADGEIGYDTTANKFKVGNGTDAWLDIEYSGADGNTAGGSPVHIGDTAPSDPAEGDLWYDTSSDTLFLFDGTAWFSTESCGSGGIEEAPEDGTQYARKDAAWEPVEAFDDTQISADLAQEVADREAGDLALQGQIEAGDLDLQSQIDALGSGGGGGWELLATVEGPGSMRTPSGYVELSQFTDEFDDYKIILSNVVGSYSPYTHLDFQIAINGSYKTSKYKWHNSFLSNNSGDYYGTRGQDQAYFQLFQRICPAGSNPTNSAEISIFDANKSSGGHTLFWHGIQHGDGASYFATGGGSQLDIGKITAIRFFVDQFNVEKGTFKLYGIKK